MTSPSPVASVVPQVVGHDQHNIIKKEQTVVASSSPVQHAVTVAPADHVLTLVSSSVVNQRGFANTCGVPLGAHLDLQPPAALGLPQVTQRHPLRCNGCSAFLNVYCKTNLPKGVWKCNMCGGVNIHKEILGEDVTALPELCAEAVEYVTPLPPATPASQAGPQGAPSPQFSSSQPPPLLPPPGQPAHLVFVVDTTLEPGELQAVREALCSLLSGPAVPPTTLVSLITCDGCVAVHNLGPSQRCGHVLPTTTVATTSNGNGLSATASALDLQSAVQLLLERHCAATAARRAGGGGSAGGDGVLVSEVGTCCGSSSSSAALPKVLASLRTVQSDVPVRARARCLLPAIEAALRLIAAHASLDLTRHHNLYGSRVIVLAAGPPTRGPGAVPLELLDQAVPEKGRSAESRSLAAALDVGAALGELGAKVGVPVDILTSCSTGINARLLTAIAHGSGGELMPQQPPPLPLQTHAHPQPHAAAPRPTSSPPGTPATAPSTPLHQQQPQDAAAASSFASTSAPGAGTTTPTAGSSSSSGGFLGPLLSRQLAAALVRRFGLEGRLDCYCSEGLRLVQWLGPLDPLGLPPVQEEGAAPAGAAAPAAAGAAAAGSAAPSAGGGGGGGPGGPYRLSSSACCVAAVEAGRCASLRLEVTRDLDDVPTLVLQVALHWLDPVARCRVVRVVTRRLAVVESRGEFLRTINPTAAAALLGKRAVLEAKKAAAFRDSRKCEEARYAVAAQLGLVATRCGSEAQSQPRRGVLGLGLGGRKSWQWPPELMPLAYALYNFQRGPLLGPPQPPPAPPSGAAASSSTSPGFPSSHHHPHGLWDSDARLAGFNALLRAAWGDAYRAMAPKLYAVLPPAPPSPAASAAPPPPPQLVALPCVSLAAVMARTAPLLLDVGTAVLVSPTEEPGHGHHGDGAADALPPSLLTAALHAVAASSTFAGGGSASASDGVGRFPVPSVVLAPGAQAGGGALAARLIPVHRDAYPEQSLQHPQLQQLGSAVAAQLSKQLVEGGAVDAAARAAAAAAAGLPAAQAKQAAAAAASFVEWCRGVHVQPFPSAAMTS